MRELKFIVNEQILEKDESCDFSNIVAGSGGYLAIRVNFSHLWNGFGKVAVFTKLLREYPVILENDYCIIPKEVLNTNKFKVKIIGKKKDVKLTTNSITIEQEVS